MLSGNISGCTGYQTIVEGVLLATHTAWAIPPNEAARPGSTGRRAGPSRRLRRNRVIDATTAWTW